MTDLLGGGERRGSNINDNLTWEDEMGKGKGVGGGYRTYGIKALGRREESVAG